MLGYFGKFVHGTRYCHTSFCFAVNALECLSAAKCDIDWLQLNENLSIKISNVRDSAWMVSDIFLEPVFGGRPIFHHSHAIVKLKFSFAFRIAPYSSSRKRDNSAVEFILDGIPTPARVLEIIQVQHAIDDARFWLKLRVFKPVVGITFSRYHVVLDHDDYEDFYAKLTTVTSQIVLLNSAVLPSFHDTSLVIACKPPIGFRCT